jgi:hypothetical protein
MPKIVPDVEEMRQIFSALKEADLLDLPGDELLINLEGLANRALPAAIDGQVPPRLRDNQNQRSLHLAIAMLMTMGEAPFNPEHAIAHFESIQGPLLRAWEASKHNDAQQMRKTIDQVVAVGSLAGWQGAREALLYMILGDPLASAGAQSRFPVGPVQKFIRFLRGGLIPNLDRIWGGFAHDDLPDNAFADCDYSFADALRVRLLQPFAEEEEFDDIASGTKLEITSISDGLNFNGLPLSQMLPGARRTLVLRAGSAQLLERGVDPIKIASDQRLIIRAFDENTGEIQIASFDSQKKTITGRRCQVSEGQPTTVMFTDRAGSDLEVWSCTCGTWRCNVHHRLSSWDSVKYPPNATLRTFVLFAVLGPKGFHMGEFKQSMLYGLLSAGVNC